MPNPRQTDRDLRLRGTWRPDRHGQGSPWPAGAPSCPGWLDKEAKAEWKRVVPKLAAAGIVGPLDRAVLVVYCTTFAQWHAAVQKLAGENLVIPGPGGRPIAHPLEKLASSLASDLLKVAAELGMSPRARRAVQPIAVRDDGDAEETSPILAMINPPPDAP
jgi:P27 family predicted phage terminase small subunit